MYTKMYPPTHTRARAHTQRRTQALTWMTELGLLMILLSPVKAAEAEEKQMTCCPLCCGPKLLYQTLPGSQLKDKSEAKLQWEVFLSLC